MPTTLFTANPDVDEPFRIEIDNSLLTFDKDKEKAQAMTGFHLVLTRALSSMFLNCRRSTLRVLSQT
jgi:hypothetical protein